MHRHAECGQLAAHQGVAGERRGLVVVVEIDRLHVQGFGE